MGLIYVYKYKKFQVSFISIHKWKFYVSSFQLHPTEFWQSHWAVCQHSVWVFSHWSFSAFSHVSDIHCWVYTNWNSHVAKTWPLLCYPNGHDVIEYSQTFITSAWSVQLGDLRFYCSSWAMCLSLQCYNLQCQGWHASWLPPVTPKSMPGPWESYSENGSGKAQQVCHWYAGCFFRS